MKVAPSGSKLRKIKHLRVSNKISINSAFSRFLANVRVMSERIMRMHFCRAWKHNDSSRFWFVALARVYYMLHTQGMRFPRARSARTQFFTFLRSSLRTREQRLAHSLAVFFQGPIGLDGPKGDPVSSPHNLHFNFGVTSARN